MERTLAVADTGFVVALLNRTDVRHAAVKAVYTTQQSVLLPQTVLAEVAYLLGREAGTAVVISFLNGLGASRFRLVALVEQDVSRIAAILSQ